MGWEGAVIMGAGALLSARQEEEERKRYNEFGLAAKEARDAQIDEQVRFNIKALSGVATDIERQKANGDVAAVADSLQNAADIEALAASEGFGGSALQYALDDIERTKGANLLSNADRLRQGMAGVDQKIESLQLEGEAAKGGEFQTIAADSPMMTLINVALAGARGYQMGESLESAFEESGDVGSTGAKDSAKDSAAVKGSTNDSAGVKESTVVKDNIKGSTAIESSPLLTKKIRIAKHRSKRSVRSTITSMRKV